jgi:hypothetical protein
VRRDQSIALQLLPHLWLHSAILFSNARALSEIGGLSSFAIVFN